MKETKIGTVQFKNAVLTASGTFGMGDVFSDFLDYSAIGGITLKTVTRNPRRGNPPPRILETPCGLLNSIGLENEGFEKVYRDLKTNDTLSALPTKVLFSIAGDTVNDYIEMARAFEEIEGIDLFEINLSCPNVHAGGATFDADCANISAIVSQIKKRIQKPISVKLSPAHNLAQNSQIVESEGGDAVTISNTYLGMAIDIRKRDFVFRNKVAGFSGPAVKPMALYNVYRVAQTVNIPIIASGGVSSADDAKEFLIAGASFISVGTTGFVEPDLAQEIAVALQDFRL